MDDKWLCLKCWWNTDENYCLADQKKIECGGEFSGSAHSLIRGFVTECTGFWDEKE